MPALRAILQISIRARAGVIAPVGFWNDGVTTSTFAPFPGRRAAVNKGRCLPGWWLRPISSAPRLEKKDSLRPGINRLFDRNFFTRANQGSPQADRLPAGMPFVIRMSSDSRAIPFLDCGIELNNAATVRTRRGIRVASKSEASCFRGPRGKTPETPPSGKVSPKAANW